MAQKSKTRIIINFDEVLKNFKGLPMQTDGEPLTMKYVAVTALLHDEPGLTGAEKFARYEAAKRYNEGGKLELERSDLDKLKACIGRAFVTLVVGVAFDVLDGKPQVEAPKPAAAAEGAVEP